MRTSSHSTAPCLMSRSASARESAIPTAVNHCGEFHGSLRRHPKCLHLRGRLPLAIHQIEFFRSFLRRILAVKSRNDRMRQLHLCLFRVQHAGADFFAQPHDHRFR